MMIRCWANNVRVFKVEFIFALSYLANIIHLAGPLADESCRGGWPC